MARSKWCLPVLLKCKGCQTEFSIAITKIPGEVVELACPGCKRNASTVFDEKLFEWAVPAFAQGIINKVWKDMEAKG